MRLFQRLNFILLGFLSILSLGDLKILLVGLFSLLAGISGIVITPSLLAGCSLLVLIIAPRYLSVARGPYGVNVFDSIRNISVFSDVIGAHVWAVALHVLSLLCFWLVLHQLVLRTKRELSFLKIGSFLVVFWIVLSWIITIFGLGRLVFPLMVMAFLSRAFIPALLYLNGRSIRSIRFTDLLWINPFWLLSLPPGIPEVLKNPEPTWKRQQELLREITTLVVVLILTRVMGNLLFSPQYFGLTDFGQIGFHRVEFVLAKKGSFAMSVLFSGVRFIVEWLWIIASLPYLMLSIIGYRVPRPVRNPFRAASFYEFMSCIMFYYSNAMVILAYHPIYQGLRKYGFSKQVRKSLSLFLSVFLFSEIFHLLRDYWIFIGSPDYRLVSIHFKEFVLYSFLLSCIVTLSSLLESRSPRPAWLRRIFCPVYFILYCILIYFGGVYRETFDAKITAVAHLFF